jgi:hypothetical protein
LGISNEANEELLISLYDMSGTQSMYQQKFVNYRSPEIYIDVPPQLKEGAYILTVHTATAKFSTRILINR